MEHYLEAYQIYLEQIKWRNLFISYLDWVKEQRAYGASEKMKNHKIYFDINTIKEEGETQ